MENSISSKRTIRVQVNGTPRELPEGTTLQELAVSERLADRGGIAIAVNETVARRGQWQERTLRDGDRILVITAAQGG